MSGMATVPGAAEAPGSPGPEELRWEARTVVAWCVALLAGGVLLGLLGGLIWSECAPRVLLQEIGAGTAEVVDVETRAYFGADVWFCAIASVAGLLTGLLGYRFAVMRRTGVARAMLAAALIAGSVAGAFTMLWVGGQLGLSGYYHNLASSPNGTQFSESLALGAKSGLACWPLFTSAVLLVAEWSTRPGRDDAPGQPVAGEGLPPG